MFLSALRNIDRGGGWCWSPITSRLGSGVGSRSLVRSVTSWWWWGVAGLSLVLDIVHHTVLISNVVHHLNSPVRQIDLDKLVVGKMKEYNSDVTL